MDKLVIALRWMAVLPAALLGIPVGLFILLIIEWLRPGDEDPIWWSQLIAAAITSHLFVAWGSYAAPSKGPLVALWLASIYVAANCFALFATVYMISMGHPQSMNPWWRIVLLGACIATAILTARHLRRDSDLI